MIMDIFICTEEAKGHVFFDIDCKTECWDTIHIAHAICASFSLVYIIPLGMYLRLKSQEILPDLNILASPTFIFMKTSIINIMIVLSKILIYN